MDPLTHTLLGASLGYAVFGRRLGRRAALVGAAAALLPDADVFIRSATEPLVAVEHHRGFTHSLTFAPVGAALAALPWLARANAAGQRAWLWACAVVAYVSHVLLDAATTYGTQLLWPWARTRFGWDLISIIDPLFTLALITGLTIALLRQRGAAAAGGVAFALLYLGWGGLQHHRAMDAAAALAALRGHDAERLEAMPTIGNNIVWRTLYLHQGHVYSDRVRVGWWSGARVNEGWSLPLVESDQLTAAEQARNVRDAFARFAWFSDHWVVRAPDDATLLGDARYTLTMERYDPIWGIRFRDDAHRAVEWVNRSRNRQVGVGELWAEIVGTSSGYRPLD